MSESKMTVSEETITPKQAKEWLNLNAKGQRTIRKGRVLQYAKDMKEGTWRLTHQGIAFNLQGELIDGQHRLQAIVAADVPVRMMVFRKAPAKVTDPIDRGSNRTYADILAKKPSLIACVKCLYLLQTGLTQGKDVTLENVRETVDACSDELELVQPLLRSKVGTAGIAAAIAFAWPVSPDKVSEFSEAVRLGEMLKSGDPPYALRDWAIRHRRGLPPLEYAYVTLAALRAYLNGDTYRNVMVSDNGYRAFCARRRTLNIDRTPDSKIVPATGNGISFKEAS